MDGPKAISSIWILPPEFWIHGTNRTNQILFFQATAMQRKETQNPSRILVGTSGYAYSEWVDAGFYPPGTGSARMLIHYAGVFPVSEINYTWYQMPKAAAMDRMRRRVSEDFRFAAKLTRTLTHEVDPGNWPAQADRYREGIAPLVQSGQLLAVLVQLPPFFRRNPHNRRYLARLLDALAGLPLAVEFRHRSWAADRVFAALRERRVALVCVDAPEIEDLFPPWPWSPARTCSTCAFTAAMPSAGGRAACKSNSITTTATRNWPGGPGPAFPRWPDRPKPASFFSTTTSAARHRKMPGR
jgi:uncharacterized protein YecE (DUF72 family)